MRSTAARQRSGAQRAGAIVVAVLLVVQAALGVLTLLWHVPLALALAHQAVAAAVFAVAVWHLHAVRHAEPRTTP